VVVIGSGPAGLAAAHFLRRLGREVTIFEAAPEAGGMLRYGIPEYRLPPATLDKDLQHLSRQGIEIRTDSALGRDWVLDDLHEQGYSALILAAGAGAAKNLPLSGSDLGGVLAGVPFLHDVADAVDQSSELADRSVLVIGGGNVAVDAARSALRLGAASVTMTCLETANEMPAYPEEVEAALAEGIEILHSWGPECFLGEEERVCAVRLVRCISVFDDSGRFAPTLDAATTREVRADTVIVAIGQEVEPELRQLPGLEFAADGFLRVDTENPIAGAVDVFACGDLALGPSSVVRAVASGRRAAEAADRYLGGSGEVPSILEPEEPDQWIGADDGFASRARAQPDITPAATRIGGFAEVESTLDAAGAAVEAGRCLQCDLRLRISAPFLPPPPWLELTEEAVAEIPAVAGVYQLLGADRVATKIVGTADLALALREELAADSPAPRFVWESDPMYTKRESELIQQFLAEHGRMPSGGEDDLDDLF
jgi:thioredoxin reductase